MKKVLIVDDAAFMRLTLKMMLERNGFEVIGEAENGEIGVAKCKELDPDIVTMDITMPVMDGIGALKQIRKTNTTASVIMVTAMGQERFILDAITSGANGFLVKPFKEENVIAAVQKL